MDKNRTENLILRSRTRIDQTLGTTRTAVHLRSATALAIFAFHVFGMDGQNIDRAILRVLGVILAWFIAPGKRDIDRVYGPKALYHLVTALYASIPLTLTAFFAWAGYHPEDQSLASNLGFEAVALAFAYLTYQLVRRR